MRIETLGTTGIKAAFDDGAEVVLTTTGRFPCTKCGDGQCEHFHQALSEWNRFRWQMAEREDCPWGPRLLRSIGIIPPFIVRPDLVYKQTRWAPFGRGEEVAPGVRMWGTVRGCLFHFGDVRNGGLKGHVYVGHDHPDGHTACLVCHRDDCEHVRAALILAEEV